METQIQPSKIVGGGQGLFASRDFQKGEEIVRITDPIWFSTDVELLQYEKDQKNAPDCCIWIHALKQWIGSKKNVRKQHWYHINHSTMNANAKPCLLEQEKKQKTKKHSKPTLVWICKNAIKKGEEIYFNYNPGCNVKF